MKCRLTRGNKNKESPYAQRSPLRRAQSGSGKDGASAVAVYLVERGGTLRHGRRSLRATRLRGLVCADAALTLEGGVEVRDELRRGGRAVAAAHAHGAAPGRRIVPRHGRDHAKYTRARTATRTTKREQGLLPKDPAQPHGALTLNVLIYSYCP